MRDWKSFDNATKRKISRLKEHEQKKKIWNNWIRETDQNGILEKLVRKSKISKQVLKKLIKNVKLENNEGKNLKETGYEDTKRKDREEKSKSGNCRLNVKTTESSLNRKN